ncbi:hypothetical protein HOY82DRAFT_490813 [Tuber indicum]|jgi:hypothetical protein|nr:hypothetical protein HOY82DRAFT_490813 [Tuber indicum]
MFMPLLLVEYRGATPGSILIGRRLGDGDWEAGDDAGEIAPEKDESECAEIEEALDGELF